MQEQEVMPVSNLNPMYDNRGFISDEPPEVQYAKVQKTFIDTRPREPIPHEVTESAAIDVVISDDQSDDSSLPESSPESLRRPVEPQVGDFTIETEVEQ